MPIARLSTRIFIIFWSLSLVATDHNGEIARIRNNVDDPEAYLKRVGPLVIMGNAPLEKANIVFLPEIHDDPKSLMTQLAIIAREKQRNRPFIVLDESLASFKKSMWDIFSQKTMEILAAHDQRRDRLDYVPQQFEQALQNLATKFRSTHGQLNYSQHTGLWTLANFENHATPFYGWDSTRKTSLVERNVQMVDTLRKLVADNDRILVMAGARHVPELEFLTSQKLLCADKKFSTINSFFNNLERRFGREPNLRNGIGATAPIYKFLNTQKYAIVFDRALYGELDRIVGQFKNRLGNSSCVRVDQ